MLKTIRRIVGQCYYGFIKRIYPERFPFGIVLGLHRVDYLDPTRLDATECLKISSQTLEKFIIDAKSNGFRFASLDEFVQIHDGYSSETKVLAITLDDAYADNYEIALPIFRKYQVPFCIFVAPGLIEDPTTSWWYLLENMILKNEAIRYKGIVYPTVSKEEKENTYWHIRNEIAVMDMTILRDSLNGILDLFDCNDYAYPKSLFMTWEQLADIYKDPLCTIGCHTYNHISFVGCTNREIEHDIALGQNKLQERLGKSADYFAYPYGDMLCVKENHRKWMHRQGFKAVFLSYGGGMGVNSDLLNAPRLTLKEGRHNIRAIKRVMCRPLREQL